MKKIWLITFGLLPALAQAGINGPTAHSRANCAGFNESVTWWLGNARTWRVDSHHYPYSWKTPAHIVTVPMSHTWRAAAYHATEAYSSRGDKWTVIGYHYFWWNGQHILDLTTNATNCNIYDGWWDY